MFVIPIKNFLLQCGRSGERKMSGLLFSVLKRMRLYLLNKQDHVNQSVETGSVKNIGDVVKEIARLLPRTFLTLVPDWNWFFDSSFYSLRNVATEINARVFLTLGHSKDNSEGREAMIKKEKQRFVDKLIERTLDTHTYARSYALHC
jgi:hypothetical protein